MVYSFLVRKEPKELYTKRTRRETPCGFVLYKGSGLSYNQRTPPPIHRGPETRGANRKVFHTGVEKKPGRAQETHVVENRAGCGKSGR